MPETSCGLQMSHSFEHLVTAPQATSQRLRSMRSFCPIAPKPLLSVVDRSQVTAT